jgi:hypothetical protein
MWVERDIAGICVGEDKFLDFELYDLANVDQTDDGFLTPAELEAAITAGTAVPLDVTGFAFEWLVRTSNDATGDPLISKTTGTGSISTVGSYSATPASNTQRVRVQLEDTDTAAADGSSLVIEPGTYRYSLKRTDAGSETIFGRGKLKLSEAPSR